MRDRKRLPSLKSGQFWAMALLLGAVLALLGAQIDYFWPHSPAWPRALAAFSAAAVAGEIWVRKYWPSMRGSGEEVREVTTGLAALVLGLTGAFAALEAVWAIDLAPSPVAWTTYVSYLLLDASYQW